MDSTQLVKKKENREQELRAAEATQTSRLWVPRCRTHRGKHSNRGPTKG